MNDFSLVVKKYNSARDMLVRRIGERDAIAGSISDARLKSFQAKKSVELYEKSIETLQNVSSVMKTTSIKNVETLITKGLHDIVDEKDLSFVIKYDSKRNFIQAQYKIHSKMKDQDYDIVNSFGGGIADVISILQRIIFVYKFNTAKVLILDESGKFISPDKQANLGKFLSDISNKLGMQVILITHKKEVESQANQVIKVTQVNGVSSAEVSCLT